MPPLKRKADDTLLPSQAAGADEASKAPRTSSEPSGKHVYGASADDIVPVSPENPHKPVDPAVPGTLVVAETAQWGGGLTGYDLLSFSSDGLPQDVLTNLDVLLRRISDLEDLVRRWTKITPAERTLLFTDPMDEERMTLWIMNALVSLGEVYCRLQGLDLDKEGISQKKDLLNRYAYKFEELEPHAHLFGRTESGPSTRLDMPAVKRFLQPSLPDNVAKKVAESGRREQADNR